MIDVHRESGPGETVLTVKGELDLDSSATLQSEIQAALKKAKLLKIDLKEVSYVDSSGIAVLIQGTKLARKSAAKIVLKSPSPQLLSVLELSQLKDFFTIE